MVRPFLVLLAFCAIAVHCTIAESDGGDENDADFLEFTDFDFEEETGDSSKSLKYKY